MLDEVDSGFPLTASQSSPRVSSVQNTIGSGQKPTNKPNYLHNLHARPSAHPARPFTPCQHRSRAHPRTPSVTDPHHEPSRPVACIAPSPVSLDLAAPALPSSFKPPAPPRHTPVTPLDDTIHHPRPRCRTHGTLRTTRLPHLAPVTPPSQPISRQLRFPETWQKKPHRPWPPEHGIVSPPLAESQSGQLFGFPRVGA